MKFTSVCKKVYSTTTGSYLEYNKEYTIYPCVGKGGTIFHYDIYDNETPIIVFDKTPVHGLTPYTFDQCFYSLEEMRDIKIDKLWD